MVNLNNLFAIMSEKGIKKSKLSADTGISTGNISDWESGRSMPTAKKLDILANYFGCSIDYLLGRTENPINNTGNIINTGNVEGEHVHGNTSVIISSDISKDTKELVELVQSLTLVQKSEIVLKINEMQNQNK